MFGDLMNPQTGQPQSTATQTRPQPQASSDTPPVVQQGSGDLEKSWRDYLSDPRVQAGLLQFSINMMSPMQPGQNFLGHLGSSVAHGGQAINRVEDRRYALEDRQREFDIANRRVANDEAQTGVARERNTIAREDMFNQNVRAQPEFAGQVARETARGTALGANEGGVFQPLSPSDIQAYLAEAPAQIMSGKANETVKQRYIQAYLQSTRPQRIRVTDPETQQVIVQEIEGIQPSLVQRQAFRLAGGSEDIPQGNAGQPIPNEIGAPAPGPEGRLPGGAGATLGEMASRGFLAGPVPALLGIARRDPTGLITDAKGAAASTQSGTELSIATGDLVRALANDPRDALEAQRIRDDLNISTGFWDSGPALVDRLVALENNLLRRLDLAYATLNDPRAAPDARIRARDRIRDVNAFRQFALPQYKAYDDSSADDIFTKIQSGEIPPGTPILMRKPDGSGYAIFTSPDPRAPTPPMNSSVGKATKSNLLPKRPITIDELGE